jgi:hypothetical protein
LDEDAEPGAIRAFFCPNIFSGGMISSAAFTICSEIFFRQLRFLSSRNDFLTKKLKKHEKNALQSLDLFVN